MPRFSDIPLSTAVPASNDSVIGVSGTIDKRWSFDQIAQTLSKIRTGWPVVKTNDFSVADTDDSIICNGSSEITATLPSPSASKGRWLHFKTIANQDVISSDTNVEPLAGGAAGTAILAGTAGKWAALQSDGAVWQIMMAN